MFNKQVSNLSRDIQYILYRIFLFCTADMLDVCSSPSEATDGEQVKQSTECYTNFCDYKVFETRTDGNCLFDALSHQLQYVCDISQSAETVRSEIVNYLSDNQEIKQRKYQTEYSSIST